MSDKSWKANERAIADLLGGKRVPVSGRQRGDAPDVDHEWLSIECKFRQTIPAWILDAMQQAIASNKGNQLPIVVLHQKGTRHINDLVILQMSDFKDYFGT